jgi:hypothetical protein
MVKCLILTVILNLKRFLFSVVQKRSQLRTKNLDNDYQWVGKCRKGNKTKGGIGDFLEYGFASMGTNVYTTSVEVSHQNYIITKIIEVGNIF